MRTKHKKSEAIRLLEKALGGRLTFGTMLASIRIGNELPQVEFAKTLSMSRAHLCDIEKGRRPVSPEKAAEYARILGYSVNQFVAQAIEDSLERIGLKLKVEIKAA